MTETGTNMFNFMFLGIATFARFGQKKTPRLSGEFNGVMSNLEGVRHFK